MGLTAECVFFQNIQTVSCFGGGEETSFCSSFVYQQVGQGSLQGSWFSTSSCRSDTGYQWWFPAPCLLYVDTYHEKAWVHSPRQGPVFAALFSISSNVLRWFFKENFLMISFYEFLYIYCLLLRVTVATLIFSSSFEYLPFSICLHSVLHCFSAFVRKPGHSSAEIASHQKNAFFSAWGTNQSESTLHSSSHFLFFSLFCGH